MHKSPGFSGRSKLSSMHLIPTLHVPSSSSSRLSLKPANTFLQPTVLPAQPKDHIQVMRVWADRREVKITIPALSLTCRLPHCQWKCSSQYQGPGKTGFAVTDCTPRVNLHLPNLQHLFSRAVTVALALIHTEIQHSGQNFLPNFRSRETL